MTDSKLLDSSVWLGYFFDNKYKNVVETDAQIYISILSLFEIKKRLLIRKIKREEIDEKIAFIKKKSLIINISNKVVEKAADISVEKEIPSIDSIIYASAKLNNLIFLTLDNDFRGLEDVEVLD